MLTLVAQGHLSANWNPLANSVAIWSLAAFVAGSLAPTDRSAATAGAVTLLSALLGYYLAAAILVDAPTTTGVTIFWVVGALTGGPVFGVAGHWWRDHHSQRRVPALALLGGVFVAEGIYRISTISSHAPAGWIMIVVGVLAPIILGKSLRERFYSLLALAPLIVLGAVALQIANRIYLNL
jgi:hypothetical protein